MNAEEETRLLASVYDRYRPEDAEVLDIEACLERARQALADGEGNHEEAEGLAKELLERKAVVVDELMSRQMREEREAAVLADHAARYQELQSRLQEAKRAYDEARTVKERRSWYLSFYSYRDELREAMRARMVFFGELEEIEKDKAALLDGLMSALYPVPAAKGP